jgi:hypothetical protein
LDLFWRPRLGCNREGTDWLNVFKTLVCYRLIDPGSEWRLHRQWFERSAMGDLLGEDAGLVQASRLYRCLDLLVETQAVDVQLPARALADVVQDELRSAALRSHGIMHTFLCH